jgi:uncharacterized phage protein gp47/JayE
MPYARQTLTQIKAQVAADIQSAVPGAAPLLRFSNLNIMGVALANLANAHYGYLDWIAKQAVPFTATDEYLYGWGALKGVIPFPAFQANNGTVTFAGSNGSVIPDLTQLVRSDGATFTVHGAVTVSAGVAIVTATADVTGIAGNTLAGAAMSLGKSISGVQSNGTISTAFTNGMDAENPDAYRTRMLAVYATPPQGGAQSDYVNWALQVPGVTRAWCAPNGPSAGSVVVYVMFDITEAAHNGFPQGSDGVSASDPRATAATGDQLSVANAIFLVQPVTALVYVVSPVANTVNFTISGISTASATTKALIAQAISGAFQQYGVPGSAINLSLIESAIAAISGTGGFVITTPIGNITNTTGHLPVLGTVSYI